MRASEPSSAPRDPSNIRADSMLLRTVAGALAIMLPLQAAAYDPAQAPRYNSPDLYRPNLDGVILRGDSSRGNVSGTSVVPSLGALD